MLSVTRKVNTLLIELKYKNKYLESTCVLKSSPGLGSHMLGCPWCVSLRRESRSPQVFTPVAEEVVPFAQPTGDLCTLYPVWLCCNAPTMLSMDAGAAMPVWKDRPSVCHEDTTDVRQGDCKLSCSRPQLPGLHNELELNISELFLGLQIL